MTPRQRAAVVDRAQALTRAGLSWPELAALAAVLAEAAEHAKVAELTGQQAGPPGRAAMWEVTARWAHREIRRFRQGRRRIPQWLADIESEYQRGRPKRPRPPGNGAQHAWRRAQEGTAG